MTHDTWFQIHRSEFLFCGNAQWTERPAKNEVRLVIKYLQKMEICKDMCEVLDNDRPSYQIVQN